MAERIARPRPLVLSERQVESLNRRDVLARRLDDGYARIERGLSHGADVTAWEEFWLSLLREYELLCDELAQAA
jgi:hypothetical protein